MAACIYTTYELLTKFAHGKFSLESDTRGNCFISSVHLSVGALVRLLSNWSFHHVDKPWSSSSVGHRLAKKKFQSTNEGTRTEKIGHAAMFSTLCELFTTGSCFFLVICWKRAIKNKVYSDNKECILARQNDTASS